MKRGKGNIEEYLNPLGMCARTAGRACTHVGHKSENGWHVTVRQNGVRRKTAAVPFTSGVSLTVRTKCLNSVVKWGKKQVTAQKNSNGGPQA